MADSARPPKILTETGFATMTEELRLRTLQSYEVLDTAAEASFDQITKIATRLFEVPIALVSLVDEYRQWFKAKTGLETCETSREISFCTYAIQSDRVFVINDATLDERFSENPLVTGSPGIRFYAGAPLTMPNGARIGTLCLIDHRPRLLSTADQSLLTALADQVVSLLELRRRVHTNAVAKDFFDLSPDMLGIANMNGFLIDLNSSWSSSLGWSKADLTGSPYIDFIHAEDRDAVLEATATLGMGATVTNFKARFRHRDGSYRWLYCNASANLVEGQIYAIVRDMTAQLNAQSELETLFANMHEGLVLQDETGGIYQHNSAALKILGLTSDELNGSSSVDPHWRAVKPDGSDFPGHEHPAMIALSTGKSQSGTVMGVHKPDGQFSWIEINASPLHHNQPSHPTHVLTTFRDITAAKNLERDLIQARESETAANRAKSELMAIVSHEIRSPLSSVIGLAHLIGATPLTSEQRDYTHGIAQSAERLLKVINDILDFSKAEAGRIEIEKIEFDLRSVLDGALRSSQVLIGSRPLTLQAAFEPSSRFYLGDPDRISQIVNNLLTNAIKFTSKGRITLRTQELAPAPRDAAHVRLRFEVKDEGVGISQEDQNRLFQPFSQLTQSTARQFGGTGLGLSICRKLVELMSGTIGVESAVGQGSTFWFELPLLRTEYPTRAQTQPSELSRSRHIHESTEPRSFRVLVVEDNPVNMKIALKQLEKLGFSAQGANGGEEAFRLLLEYPFDLILMDCQMPGIDGYQTTRQIRSSANPKMSSIPIVALTANAMSGDHEKCLDAGMNDYLTKPVDLATLKCTLEKWTSTLGKEKQTLDREHLAELRSLEAQGDSDFLAEMARPLISK